MEAQSLDDENPDLVDRLTYKSYLVDWSLAPLLRESALEILRLRRALESVKASAQDRMTEIQRLEREVYRTYG